MRSFPFMMTECKFEVILLSHTTGVFEIALGTEEKYFTEKDLA